MDEVLARRKTEDMWKRHGEVVDRADSGYITSYLLGAWMLLSSGCIWRQKPAYCKRR